MSNKDQYGLGPPPQDGDSNYGGILIGVNWVVFTPALAIVCLRVFTRVWISHNLGWDDAMIVLTQLFNSVGMGFVMLEVHWGLGRHRFFLQPEHYESFLKYNWLDWNQVFVTLCLSKIAICMFLLRISKFDRWRRFLHGVIAFLIFSHLPLCLLFLLQCLPVEKNWAQSRPGKCFSLFTIEKIIIVQGVFSIITDFILAAFPLLLLRNMRLPKRQKIQLNLLLGLGVVTGLVSIIRTAFSYEVKQEDLTHDGVPNALCRMLEINFGIIAACMPMMRTLAVYVKKKYTHRGSEGLNSTRKTTASQLQWFKPPTLTPWYLRVKRNVWHPKNAADIDQDSGQSSDGSLKGEKGLPVKREWFRPPPSASKPIPRSYWPQHYERPENATWAKDDFPKVDNSIDLPIQGARKSGYEGGGDDENDRGSAGNSRFNWGLG